MNECSRGGTLPIYNIRIFGHCGFFDLVRRRTVAKTMTRILLLLTAALLPSGVQGFYLPGVSPYSFSEGEA